MSAKSLFLIFLAILVLVLIDVFFYPEISFSVIVFSICYLFLKRSDYLFIFAIIQMILDLVLFRTFGLIFIEWIFCIYLIDLIQKKYFYQEVKMFKLFMLLAIFVSVDTAYHFVSGAFGLENTIYLIYMILKRGFWNILFAFIGLSVIAVVSNKIKARNFLKVS